MGGRDGGVVRGWIGICMATTVSGTRRLAVVSGEALVVGYARATFFSLLLKICAKVVMGGIGLMLDRRVGRWGDDVV